MSNVKCVFGNCVFRRTHQWPLTYVYTFASAVLAKSGKTVPASRLVVAPKIVMISYERLHVGLQVLSAENFCLGYNFMEKWSLMLVKKISSSWRIRESSRHCCAPPGEGSVGCPTPQQGIGAAQGKTPRSKTDLKFSSLCPSTCWVHSFVYNNNVYYFTVGFFIVVTDHFFGCIALSHMCNSNLSG